jgi:7-cyano-7-deazaguanine reductase
LKAGLMRTIFFMSGDQIRLCGREYRRFGVSVAIVWRLAPIIRPFQAEPEIAMTTRPTKILETFANPAPYRDYQIHMEIPEFTCLCPKTGQPDFAVLTLDYVADKLCVELKSLKLYVWGFREEGHFHEDVTNRILDDLVKATKPRFMRLTARFFVRGGIFTNVVAEHRKKGWKPAPHVELESFATQSNVRGGA